MAVSSCPYFHFPKADHSSEGWSLLTPSLTRRTHCTCALQRINYLTKYQHNSEEIHILYEEIHILYKTMKTRVIFFFFFFFVPGISPFLANNWNEAIPILEGQGCSQVTHWLLTCWEGQKTQAPKSESSPLFLWAWNDETTKNTKQNKKSNKICKICKRQHTC